MGRQVGYTLSKFFSASVTVLKRIQENYFLQKILADCNIFNIIDTSGTGLITFESFNKFLFSLNI